MFTVYRLESPSWIQKIGFHSQHAMNAYMNGVYVFADGVGARTARSDRRRQCFTCSSATESGDDRSWSYLGVFPFSRSGVEGSSPPATSAPEPEPRAQLLVVAVPSRYPVTHPVILSRRYARGRCRALQRRSTHRDATIEDQSCVCVARLFHGVCVMLSTRNLTVEAL